MAQRWSTVSQQQDGWKSKCDFSNRYLIDSESPYHGRVYFANQFSSSVTQNR
jgi:hypothetical protein